MALLLCAWGESTRTHAFHSRVPRLPTRTTVRGGRGGRPARPSSPPLRAQVAGEVEEREEGSAAKAVRAYFEAWNRRDMETAAKCFAPDCVYEDTQYADAFSGEDALIIHLNKVGRGAGEHGAIYLAKEESLESNMWASGSASGWS